MSWTGPSCSTCSPKASPGHRPRAVHRSHPGEASSRDIGKHASTNIYQCGAAQLVTVRGQAGAKHVLVCMVGLVGSGQALFECACIREPLPDFCHLPHLPRLPHLRHVPGLPRACLPNLPNFLPRLPHYFRLRPSCAALAYVPTWKRAFFMWQGLPT